MIELILNLVQSVVVRRDAGVVDLLESHDHRISNAGLVDRNHFAVVVEPVRFRAQDFHLGTSRRADLRHFRLLFRRRGSFTLFLRNEKREKKVSARTPKKHYYIGSSSRVKTSKKQPLKKKIRLVLIRPEIYRPSTKEWESKNAALIRLASEKIIRTSALTFKDALLDVCFLLMVVFLYVEKGGE